MANMQNHGTNRLPYHPEDGSIPNASRDALMDRVNFEKELQELHHQLQHATMVRVNYEKQLHQLVGALQAERLKKGESSLRVHELENEVEELQKAKQELQDQAEHWKFRAQEALEQKALCVMRSDPQNKDMAATEEIVLDIKKLQQSEAYWRQQAKMLGHEHEVAEAEIHKMIRDRQRDCDTLREKEQSEQKLREEIDFLQKTLLSIASNAASRESSECSTEASTLVSANTYKPSQIENHIKKQNAVRAAPPSVPDKYQSNGSTTEVQAGNPLPPLWSTGTTQASLQTHKNGVDGYMPNPPNIVDHDKLVQLQMELLRLGEYEEAEKVSLQFNVGGVSFHQMENSVEGLRNRGDNRAMNNGSLYGSQDSQQIEVPEPDQMERQKRGAGATPAPQNLSGGSLYSSHGTGYSIIGEAQIQVIGQYQQHAKPQCPPNNPLSRTNSATRAPPLHEKLALENKLASTEMLQQINAQTPTERWKLRVTVASAKLVPWKNGTKECCCCLSILQPSVNISSRSFHSILHVPVGQNESPLAVVGGALQIRAMDRTSVVAIDETILWNETIILTEMHPAAVHVTGSPIPSVEQLAMQALDGRPALLFVTIQSIDGHSVQQVGRTAVLIQGQGSHTQSFTLLHSNGTPVLSQSGHPATIEMRYSYTPLSSPDDQVLPPNLVEDVRKGSLRSSRSSQDSRSKSKTPRSSRRAGIVSTPPDNKPTSQDGAPQISATLGFSHTFSSMEREGRTSSNQSMEDSMFHGERSNPDSSDTIMPPGLSNPDSAVKIMQPVPVFTSRKAQRSAPTPPGMGANAVGHAGDKLDPSRAPNVDKESELEREWSRRGGTGSSDTSPNSLATSQSSTQFSNSLATSHGSLTQESGNPDRSSHMSSPPSPTLLEPRRPSPTLLEPRRKTKHGNDDSPRRKTPSGRDGSDNSAPRSEVVYIVRQSSNDNTSGRSRVGIGISFGITRTGEIFITGLSPKGPAKASGKIKEGDQLLAVDGVDIKDWQVADIVQLILGKPGSKLRLDIVPAQVDMQGNIASAAPEIKQTEQKQPTMSRPSQQPPPEQTQPTLSKPSFNPPPPDLNSNDHEVTNVESVEVPAAVTPEFVEEPAVTPARPLMNYAEGTMTPARNNAEGTMTQAQWARRQLAKMGDGLSNTQGFRRPSSVMK